MRPTLRHAPFLVVALSLAAPAAAQVATPRTPQQAPAQAAPPLAAAPALPGLAARRAPAPIPGQATGAMSPNAALFDAINRGDLAAARDAMGRGATLEARNALGLTPLDAAVDQGRNDIVFYLLSTREVSRGAPPPPPAGLSGPPPAAAARAPVRRESPAAAAVTRAVAQPAAPSNARLWANDGGAPQPEIGFLGFDAGRPDGATPPRR